MTEAPGTTDAAFLAFVLIEELIKSLRSSGALTEPAVAGIFNAAIERLEHDTRALAKPGAVILRKMLTEQGLK